MISLRQHVRSASLLLVLGCSHLLPAQEMQPRAYIPAPVGLGYVSLAYSHNAGSLLFDPSLPVEDAHVVAHNPSLGLGATFGVLGRTSQVLVILPYVAADLTGRYAGAAQYRYRSGLADMTLRYSIDLIGAPAMKRSDFLDWRQKTIVGVSLTATAPVGQYDPNVQINISTNRWGLKPEVGISKAFGKWALEGAFGVWLYTTNSNAAGNSTVTQTPLLSTQAHIVRVVKRRHWVAFDATYFAGGRVERSGLVVSDARSNDRTGLTYGFALSRRQAIRFSYFEGIYARFGGDIRSLGIAYQVVWSRGR